MTLPEDRDEFERIVWKDPYMARMFSRANPYVGSLAEIDREAFVRIAMNTLWDLRDRIKVSNDVTRLWDQALKHTALSRKRWLVWSGVDTAWIWVSGKNLGRHQ